MQPNVITLSVDALNDETTTANVNVNFTRFDEYQNRTVYIGDNHQMDAKDTLTFYRSTPTSNGNFKGVMKTSVKFTKDVVVTGVDGVSSLTAPIILEVSFSVPVGASAAALLLARQTALALVDRDDIMDSLNRTLMI